MSAERPVWAADTPVSMPEGSVHEGIVSMFGFSFSAYGIQHDLSEVEYAALRVPHYAPRDPSRTTVFGDEDVSG